MPLIKSGSKAAVSQNIRELRASKYPEKQSVAIALSNQRKYRKAGGKNLPQFDPISLTIADIARDLPARSMQPVSGLSVADAPSAMPALIDGTMIPDRLPAADKPIILPQHKPGVPQQSTISGYGGPSDKAVYMGLEAPPEKPWRYFDDSGPHATDTAIPQAALYGGYHSGGRAGFAGGGTPSPVPAPAGGNPLGGLSQMPVQTPDQVVGYVPMSAMTGGAGSNGIVAPVSGLGIPTMPSGGMQAPAPAQTAQAAPQAQQQQAPAPQPKINPGASIYSLFPQGIPQDLNQQLGAFNSNGNGVVTNAMSFADMPSQVQQMLENYIYPKANGGGVPQFANGGSPSTPWFVRNEAKAGNGNFHSGGLFGGSTPGRADTIHRDVPANSYVIPADVVGAVGQGNTLAGANRLNSMFHSMPYGVSGGSGHAHAPKMKFANGGASQGTVPIAASDGEFLVTPEAVTRLGNGDAKRGFSILDTFVKQMREKHIKTLKGLPGPRKS